MYLYSLNSNERELFLQACLHVSCADRNFSFDEKKVIQQLCQEMQIPVSYEINQSIDQVIDEISKTSTLRNKKIFLFELAGVVMADDVCDDTEREMMLKIANRFDISNEFVDESINKISKLVGLYKEISEFIS